MHLNHVSMALDHGAECEIVPDAADGWVEVRVAGQVDQAGVRAIEGSVRFAASDAAHGVLIDCSGCRFVDSSGLRLLVETQQMASARGIGWRLRPSEQLRQLLVLTSLEDMLLGTPATL
jgi:anti-anti-sigma factor